MRRYGLGMMAIVSVVIAAVVSAGYFGNFILQARRYDPCFELLEGGVSYGAIGCARHVSPNYRDIGKTDFHFEYIAIPSFKYISGPRAMWEWKCSETKVGPASTLFLIEFPICCALLPCSIAPILWLRKRRRMHVKGFPVEPATPTVADD
jgi:hypothetical protein